MRIKLTACVYSCNEGTIEKDVDLDLLRILGFQHLLVKGDVPALIDYFNDNKADMLIADMTGFEEDRFCSAMNLIYNNYCKNIIIVSNGTIKKNNKMHYVDSSDKKNLDLKLSEKILEVKNGLQKKPPYNIVKVKTKIHELFTWLKFSPKHSGFRYFVDATAKAYFKYPDKPHIVNMYNEIGETYNKTGFAIEKAMRTALANAIKAVRRSPDIPENREIKELVKPDLSNLNAISIVVGKLLTDKEFGTGLYGKV